MNVKNQIALAVLAVFFVFAGMTVNGESVLCAGMPLFNDSLTYIFEDVPAPFIGKTYLKSSFKSGGDLVLDQPGFVYVIVPASGTQGAGLQQQGYKEVSFRYSPNIWKGLPAGFKLKLFEKQVASGDRLGFGRWGGVILSDEKVVFDSSAREVNSALVPVPQGRPWWTQRHQQKLLEIQKEQGAFDLVLLGDSITQRWETNSGEAYGRITSRFRTLNLGYSGDRTQHVLWRIANGELDGIHPKAVVVLIGTNNLPPKRSTPEETIQGVREIIRQVREKLPETKIVIYSIFPRGGNAQDPIHQAVARANQGIIDIAREQGLIYLDIGKLFLDPQTGAIRRDRMPDCLHPGPAGYADWADTLIPLLNGFQCSEQPLQKTSL